MTGLSSTGEAAVLTTLTTSAYVSLHTADPANTGASEVSGGGYGRAGPTPFANSGGGNPTVASNSALVTFPAPSGTWGTVAYFGVWDALTSGNFRGSGALTTPKPVVAGDTVRFLANALTITAD